MRGRSSRLVLLLTAVALLALISTACTPAPQETPTTPTEEPAPTTPEPTTYSAVLAPNEGVTSPATGSATVEISGDVVTFKVDVAQLNDIQMAHIHISDTPGGTGDPGVWLYPAAPPPVVKPGTTDGELAAGTLDPATFVGPLEGKTVADLVTAITEGRAYVNIHTDANPNGEITGFLQ